MSTSVWFPLIRSIGGRSLDNISSQLMYRYGDTVPTRGIGKVLDIGKKRMRCGEYKGEKSLFLNISQGLKFVF